MLQILANLVFIIFQLLIMGYGVLMLFSTKKIIDWNDSMLYNRKGELGAAGKFSIQMQKLFGEPQKKWWFAYQVKFIGLLLILFSIVTIYLLTYNGTLSK